ncbi:MAG: type II secretion system protein GspG [Acidobacteria bacterium]|nr:type II secretion system protein GspG [Acidobacteriota bacterium]MBV9477226.1 type II secretion system protein GspG [Acidobacteriota bacterium]
MIVIGVFFVAIAGILAAIAVPNFLTAMQRAKQKRTMADMRALAIAVEAYATDHNVYPRAEDLTSLQSVLTPTYVKAMPKTDAWDHPLRYQCWPEPQCQTYSVGSAGKDGRWEHESLQDYDARSGGATTKFDCDIVFTNGSFVQYPEGVQVK